MWHGYPFLIINMRSKRILSNRKLIVYFSKKSSWMVFYLFLLYLIFWKILFFHTSHREGRVGVVVGLTSRGTGFVIDKEKDPSHCCVWVSSFINGKPIGLCLVYTPNISNERCDLWEWMEINFIHANGIIGGDLNMVKHQTYRSLSDCKKVEQWRIWQMVALLKLIESYRSYSY